MTENYNFGIRPRGCAEADIDDVAPNMRRGELLITVDNTTDRNPQRLLIAKVEPETSADFLELASYDVSSTNISFGIDAGQSSGDNNTAIGIRSLEDITTGNNNTAVGYQAGLNLTTGSSNTFIGQNAGGLGIVTGTNNMVIGSQAGYDLTSGQNNAMLGVQAAENLTTGSNNIAIGTNAIRNATTASNITAVGAECLSAGALTGQQHSALGYRALYANTSGTGSTAVGYQALYDVTTASANTALGWRAGFDCTSAFNVFVGYNTDVGSTSHTRVICLGVGAVSTQSYEFVVGSSSYPIDNLRIGEQASGNPLLMGDATNLAYKGETFGIATSKTPSSASDTGTAGMIAWDSDYVYVCVATNTWKRTALTTW